jgi:hypothetical protein
MTINKQTLPLGNCTRRALPLLLMAAAMSLSHAAEAPELKTGAAGKSAAVYVYRYKQYQGSAIKPSVYCDGQEVAKMHNGRYFRMVLPAGKHTFGSSDKQSGMEIDLKPGQEYYVRVEIATGFLKGHGRMTLVAKEQGTFEIKKLKWSDAGHIRDAERAQVGFGIGEGQ